MPQFNLCDDLSELNVQERLNYVFGQVLGVKDFQQEQAYFLHKARLHNRSLHGYGTVWGLEVSYDNTGDDLEIQVSPGLAIDSQGREIYVDAVQCAKLNKWLIENPMEEDAASKELFVTLCYYPCQTGEQPILGDPCRTDTGPNGAIQYTRIRDHFDLQLRLQPPLHLEESMIERRRKGMRETSSTSGQFRCSSTG